MARYKIRTTPENQLFWQRLNILVEFKLLPISGIKLMLGGMIDVKCEICGNKKAEHICSRCHRLICDECYCPQFDLCSDCLQVREATKRDYLNLINRLESMALEIKDRFKISQCRDCPIMRELLLTSLANLKRIKALLEVNGYLEERDKAETVYRVLEGIAAAYISNLLFRLKTTHR